MKITMPTFQDSLAARARCGDRVRRTPLLRSAILDRAVGGTVLLKAETLQHTGSFKLRGAMNAVLSLVESGHTGGIVAFSSGNHAQATAYAAAACGLCAAPEPKCEAGAASWNSKSPRNIVSKCSSRPIIKGWTQVSKITFAPSKPICGE